MSPDFNAEVSPPLVKRPYRRRLMSLGNVRTALADVVRKLEMRHIDPQTGRAMVYALSMLANVMRAEGRPEDSEEAAGSNGAECEEKLGG